MITAAAVAAANRPFVPSRNPSPTIVSPRRAPLGDRITQVHLKPACILGLGSGFTTDVRIRVTNPNPNWQSYQYKRSVIFDLAPQCRLVINTTWQQSKMASSIERSRDMQMKSCDVIGHVTALDESEPSTRLTRCALWRRFHYKTV